MLAESPSQVSSRPVSKRAGKPVRLQTATAPTEIEAHIGLFYELQVRQVAEHGFTAEAVILQNFGDSWVLCDVVGSADALLDSLEAAEELASQLAREWIEEHG